MELPFLVLASSLKRHLKSDRKVVLHAFHSDPIAHDHAYFAASNSATFELRLQHIENRFHDTNAWPGHVTAASLLRLQLPSALNELDRVVYLDCDIVVLKDITTLYDSDLSGFPLAACPDFWLTGTAPFAPPGWGVEAWHKFLSEVVGLADYRTYFNAGVLVMDLKRFRGAGLAQVAEKFLEQTNYKTPFIDQDALNHAIDGAFIELDSRWNVLATLGHPDPWIMHYAGPYKPWSCEGRPITIWNQGFWQEAAQSAVLPHLARAYLETCESRGLAGLRPSGVLLSSGKPRLSKGDFLAHAKKYRSFAEATWASESIARDFDRRPNGANANATSIPVDRLSHRGGVHNGETLIFNLKIAEGYLVLGPHIWYPVGNYEATFNLALTDVVPGPTSRLMIDIVDNADRCIAQRELSISAEAETTLQFAVEKSEVFLAFRVFATGFPSGELRFGGVKLRPAGAAPSTSS